MKPITGKASFSVLLGAAFLMATSSIGPGFMLQTAAFTNELKADFAFAIVVSVIFLYYLHSLMCGRLLVYLKCVVKILRIRYCQPWLYSGIFNFPWWIGL